MRSKMKWAMGALVVACAASPAIAQTVNGAPTEGDVSFKAAPQLSPEEQVAQSEAVVAQLASRAQAVAADLKKAREDRDVVKTLCLSDKLSQLDVTLRSAKDRLLALRSATSRGDTELANHEFTIMDTGGMQHPSWHEAVANKAVWRFPLEVEMGVKGTIFEGVTPDKIHVA
jgi:hypothetical protein